MPLPAIVTPGTAETRVQPTSTNVLAKIAETVSALIWWMGFDVIAQQGTMVKLAATILMTAERIVATSMAHAPMVWTQYRVRAPRGTLVPIVG